MFRATGGSEAVDIAVQAAMLHTGRSGVLSVEGCYHGNTIGGRSLGDTRDEFPNRLQGCRTIKPPLDVNATDRLETVLKSREIAAVIMEPVICNLGLLSPKPTS